MLIGVFEGFSDAAKAAIEAARMWSHRLGVSATRPEHLLLGVLTTSPGVATAFADFGITAAHLERLVADAQPVPLKRRSDRFTPTSTRVLEMSLRERLALGDPVIEVEHLALALTNEGCKEIAGMVRSLGTSRAELRVGLLARLGHTGSEPTSAWPGSTPSASDSGPRGCSAPNEVALRGFAPDAQAHIVNVRYQQADHAVVQVGFPGKAAYYYLSIFRHQDGWRLEIPEGRSS